jgi:hypothetical protein
MANPTAPYSILKPDTSSDSPSAKSKGVRLVSATQEINHSPITGIKIAQPDHTLLENIKLPRPSPPLGRTINKIISANLTS